MSSISSSDEKQGFKAKGGVMMDTPTSVSDPSPPPAPAPPLQAVNVQRRRRVRSFYWKPIPEERVHQQGAHNLWTNAKHSGKQTFYIDIRSFEELFGQHDTHSPITVISNKHQGTSSPCEQEKEISILDPRRSMNVAIFLKCFKKSGQLVINDVLVGNSTEFGAEALRQLIKLLPDKYQVEKLLSYKGDQTQLNKPDWFMYQLTHLPRFDLRLKAMLLKEEFPSLCSSLKQDILIIHSAIRELLICEELHALMHLVLEAGNVINAGGYGGNAVGFKISSLLSLSETKSNKPELNLLHFVALEAQKKDEQLLKFVEKLQCVSVAARVSLETWDVELENLNMRVKNLQQEIQNDTQLLKQLHTFLQDAVDALQEISISRSLLKVEEEKLIDFFCEDKETFNLDKCFYIFHQFCSKFTKAVQENIERVEREKSRMKRMQSLEKKRCLWVGFHTVGGVVGSRCSSEIDVFNPASFSSHSPPPGVSHSHQPLSNGRANTHSHTQSHTHSAQQTHTLHTSQPLPQDHHDNNSEESNIGLGEESELGLREGSELGLAEESEVGLRVESEEGLGEDSEVGLEEESEVGLWEESEVGLEEESDVGLGEESEVALGQGSKVGLGKESEVGLKEWVRVDLREGLSGLWEGPDAELGSQSGVELHVGSILQMNNKVKTNINLKHNEDVITPSPTCDTASSLSSQSELNTIRDPAESCNQKSDSNLSNQALGSKERKKNLSSAKKIAVTSFRHLSLKKTPNPVVSHGSSHLSLSKLRPLHPVRTRTRSEAQSMRKVITVNNTKPRSQTIPDTAKTRSPAHSKMPHQPTGSTHKASPPQKSTMRKMAVLQKEEKPCHSTLCVPAPPTPQNPTHNKCATPHFPHSTVATAPSNFRLRHSTMVTTSKPSNPTASSRTSKLSMPTKTGSDNIPLPADHIRKSKVAVVPPAWR